MPIPTDFLLTQENFILSDYFCLTELNSKENTNWIFQLRGTKKLESKREYQVKQKSLNFSSSRTYHFLLVELEGIEPSSKRGNHKLSTCLSLPNFSSNGRTKAINHCLIL